MTQLVSNASQPDFLEIVANSLPPFGRFRYEKDAQCLLEVTTDLEAVRVWLDDRARSPHTRESYYREISRLYVWASVEVKKPLSGLGRDDFIAFLKFVQSIPEEWKGKAKRRNMKDGAHNPEWRPFVKELSDSSIEQMFRVITALYSYWHSCGYTTINPLKRPLGSVPKRSEEATVERYLEPAVWSLLLDFIDAMPRSTHREAQHYERVRWIFHFAYLSAARLSEMAGATMGDFHVVRGSWWLRIRGKGETVNKIPVADELLSALSRYRFFNGLPLHPSPSEQRRAVLSLSGSSPLTGKSIYLIIKRVCAAAAVANKESSPDVAATLNAVTTHWLRHSSASHRLNDHGQDVRTVQRFLRHSNLKTTMRYLHQGDQEFHDAATTFTVRGSKGTPPKSE